MQEYTPSATVHVVGRTVFFVGEIFSISAFQLVNEVRKLEKKSKKPITIEINSSGGDIVDGLAAYDALKLCTSPIYTIGTGCVESMGVILFLAGSKRACTESCTFMYHVGSLSFEPGEIPLTSVQRTLNDALRLDALCNSIVHQKTIMSYTELDEKILGGDWYFNANQAKQHGFIHNIIKR